MSKQPRSENDKAINEGGFETTAVTDKSGNQAFTEELEPLKAAELPGVLTNDIFTEIANYKSKDCISIFLGAHSAGVEVNEGYDVINFKNQLQEAGRRLQDKGYNEASVHQLLEPGY